MRKPVLLCLVHLPPPMHGVTAMSQAVVHSKRLASFFRIEIIPIRFCHAISDIGRMSMGKFSRVVSTAYHLFKTCVSKRPDMVYVTLTPTGKAFFRDLLFVAIIRLMRLPRVFHLHGKGIKNEVKDPLKKSLYLWAFKDAQIILLYPGHYEDIESIHGGQDCYILPNGIEDLWRDGEARSKIAKVHPKVLFFSNMVRSKGPLELLKALSIVKDRGIFFHAEFAGEWSSGAFRKRFYEVVRERGLEDRVSYLGPKYGGEKGALLASADIFVLPTLNETFPLVILEAMSSGLPVIATREGGIPDVVVDGHTGYVVKKRDNEVLAERLALLLENAELRLELGCAGRKRFEDNFTLQAFEDNLVKVLKQCFFSNTCKKRLDEF